ncbi:class I SAM-dependent methyltransferase [Patescibacteria group bacterium]|nr:class I SAM-dependent methyltransferase [Patescibacteria group bacterium]
MTPKEYVDWFYKKFNDGLKSKFSPDIINREHLDQEEIIKLIEEHNCKSVLEIGTWEGQTGLLIWLHPNVEKFRAIDIHKDMNIPYTSAMHNTNEVEKEFIGHYLKNTNTEIDFIDTMKWKPSGHFDMVFIDGNHDLEHVRNDTLKALELNPKIIVWHDIAHNTDTDCVPMFLEEFKQTHPQYIIHIIKNTEIGYILT